MIKIKVNLEARDTKLIKLLALFDGDDLIVTFDDGETVWGTSGGIVVTDDPTDPPTLWIEDIFARSGENYAAPVEQIREVVV